MMTAVADARHRGRYVPALLLVAAAVVPVTFITVVDRLGRGGLVADFVPVLGHADYAIIVAVALRSVTRRAGPEALDWHWPGTPDGLGHHPPPRRPTTRTAPTTRPATNRARHSLARHRGHP